MEISKTRRLAWLGALTAAIIIIVDQVVKCYVKTHFYLGEDVEVLPFFHLRFIQNNGMAFGIELGSKLFLTFFRIVLVGFLAWYLVRIARVAKVSAGYMTAVSLVAAGALGNIIDCVFYGEIFTNPYPPVTAEFVPWGEGYGGLFHGRWSICSTSHCSLSTGPSGFPLSEAANFRSSILYSTLPIPP